MKILIGLVIIGTIVLAAYFSFFSESSAEFPVVEDAPRAVKHSRSSEESKRPAATIIQPQVISKETPRASKKTQQPVRVDQPQVVSRVPGAPKPYKTAEGTFLRRGELGVIPGGKPWVGQAVRYYFNLKNFVHIESVEKNSPASQSGFQNHDLLLSLDDAPLASYKSMSVLLSSRYSAGQLASVKVFRQGEFFTYPLKITAPESLEKKLKEGSGRWKAPAYLTGLKEGIADPAEVLKHHMKIADLGGYPVKSCPPKLPAFQAGIRPFDLILSINNVPLNTENYGVILAQYHPGDAVEVKLIRKAGRFTIPVILAEKIVRLQDGEQAKEVGSN